MKCPYCNGNMESGTISYDRRSRICWVPDGNEGSLFLATKEELENAGAILPGDAFPFQGKPIPAHICRSCGKGIFSFEYEK